MSPRLHGKPGVLLLGRVSSTTGLNQKQLSSRSYRMYARRPESCETRQAQRWYQGGSAARGRSPYSCTVSGRAGRVGPRGGRTFQSRMKMEVVGVDEDDEAANCAIIRSSSRMSEERETAFSVAPDSSTV